MSIDLEAIKDLMPWFLDGQSKSDLFQSVKQLADKQTNYSNYFISSYTQLPSQLRQGDVYKEMPVLSLPSVRVTKQNCMILSNSCSISTDNNRPLEPRIVYAPVILLSKLKNLLEENGKNAEAILEKTRQQQIMNFFYLPTDQYNTEERVVLFDQILSVDYEEFDGDNLEERNLLRLSRNSLYHLIIKLTAYFARITQEIIEERV